MIFDNTIVINEEAIFTKNNKNPVYIVLSSGNSLFAKGIKAVTKSEFSHAMISFNSKLDPLYSFGTKEDGKRLGFVINNPKDHVFDIDEVKYSVYVMYVTDKAKKAMKDALQFFIDNKDKLRYDFHGIADIWRGKTSDQRNNKWFCSRFVMYLISKATELSKSPSLWRPSDIADLDNISLVNRGFNFYNYDYKVTEKHCNNIKNGKYNIGDVLNEETNSSSPTVFFIKDISAESLVHIYQEAAYCHEDYRESAIMATNKLNQLHDNYQMMNITTRDIELEDGKWIFAEYIIDNDIDKGNVIRFTNFINKIIETSIYEGCIESPCEYRPTGILAISEKSIYDICTEDIKYYQNPSKQLQIKNTKKKNSKIKTGNYSGLQNPVPKTTTNDKTVEEQVIEDLEKIADDAHRLLSREIFNCKDCAYVYKDIMLPYTSNTFAVIGWDLNKLKDRDKLSFPNCRDAVFNYCKNKFNHTHPGYCLDFDNNCFYIYKK